VLLAGTLAGAMYRISCQANLKLWNNHS